MYCAGCMSNTFLFFFQAEDGIRDIGVTGVQTCALPIWNQIKIGTKVPVSTGGSFQGQSQFQYIDVGTSIDCKLIESGERSEERRVGKECRSRWSSYDQRKNKSDFNLQRIEYRVL